jgi:hypothetical protein
MEIKKLDEKLITDVTRDMRAAGCNEDALVLRTAIINAHARNPRADAEALTGILKEFYAGIAGKGVRNIDDLKSDLEGAQSTGKHIKFREERV